MQKSRIALCGLAAMVFCGILYRYGMSSWFQQDDFPRLGLRLAIHSPVGLFHALFDPMAQGTFRPFSEKAFYIGLSSIFGLSAGPYRAIVFLTQFANLILLSIIAFTLMESYAAAFWAPVLWVANSALSLPMTWTAAYNEVLCSTCFLLSFYFFLQYTSTGRARFNRYQWAVFLLGFGALETNTVYPLIPILYASLFARRYLKSALWLLVPSIAFSLIDRLARLHPANNVYELRFDVSMFRTGWTYWTWALGPDVAAGLFPRAHVPALFLTIACSAAILGFATWRISRGDRKPILFLGWFIIALLPYLPLWNHVSDYYLTIPLIGLALLGSYAVARSKIAYLIVAVYLVCSVPSARKNSKTIAVRSAAVKKLVSEVARAQERARSRIILLDGVTDELFWTGVYDRPFPLVGAREVYLTPASVALIHADAQLGNLADYTLPEAEMTAAIREHRATVLSTTTGTDVTEVFTRAALQTGLPTRIDLGHPAMPSLLGPTWYAAEGESRWMPKQATVVLGTPGNTSAVLRVNFVCVPIQTRDGPILLQPKVGAQELASVKITACSGAPQMLSFPVKLAPEAKQATVALEVNRTIRVGFDLRDLGLSVRWIELQSSP